MTSVLIRQSVVRKGGKKAYHDLEVDESEITIGSAATNIIRLSGEGVAPEHAVLLVNEDAARLRAVGKQRVVVNEKAVRRARVREGDLLELGANVIEILPTPPGFDLAVKVETAGEDDEYHVPDRYSTHLQHTGLSKRRPAWGLAILVLVLFFGLPFTLSRLPVTEETKFPAFLTDAIWTSGELHPRHQLATDNDCSACHVELFLRVRDEACLECHQPVWGHAEPDRMLAHGLVNDRCGACHREHNDASMLVDQSSAACTNCHAFESFANGHPDFSSYPYSGRTGIIFDHTLHRNNNFRKTGRAFNCSDCHDLDGAGQQMVVGSFENTCVDCHGNSATKNPSKIFHHGDQVIGGKPIAVFTLPRLDQRQIEAMRVALGAWPAGTKRGSRAGLTRLGLTPLTELMLASDDDAAIALGKLKRNKTKLASLKRASVQDMADVAKVAWATKRLLADLTEDWAGTLKARLGPALRRNLGRRELAALSGQLPPAIIESAVSEWFPADIGEKSLAEDLAGYAAESGVDAPKRAESVDFGVPGATPEWPGIDWIRIGQWQVQKYSLQYQPSGHNDDFVKAWLNVSLALMNVPENFGATGERFGVGDAATQVFEALADSDAKPGEAKGPGRCTKCHSRTGPGATKPGLNWTAFRPDTRRRGHTRFRHSSHSQLGSQDACLECHRPKTDIESDHANSKFLEAYLDDSDDSISGGNFVAIEKEVCGKCHAPEAAGDGCLVCHSYHVDPLIPGSLLSATSHRKPASRPPL